MNTIYREHMQTGEPIKVEEYVDPEVAEKRAVILQRKDLMKFYWVEYSDGRKAEALRDLYDKWLINGKWVVK